MPIVDVFNMNREIVGQVDLPASIFDVPVKNYILHDVVLYQLAKRRAGTAKVKGRSEVRGGGRKPWRQKGTGRARAGSIRSPLWRGGGIVHGPKPRSYLLRIPKKVRKQALRMVLSHKLQDNQLTILDQLRLERIKTKDFVEIIERFEWQKPLVVIPQKDEIVEKSARNIPGVKVLRSEGLNVYDILNHQELVLTKECIDKIEESLGS